jgi:hypothetical protein
VGASARPSAQSNLQQNRNGSGLSAYFMNKKELIMNLRAEAWDQTDSKVEGRMTRLQVLLDKEVWNRIASDVEIELWKWMQRPVEEQIRFK